jgi:hypothetical protein
MNGGVGILRGALCVAMFSCALGAGCWAIREALPFPDVALVKPKIEHFAAQHDDYDTLFLGSSRIYYQIIPALFDRLAAEQGLPTRSFNAAIAGMRPPEDAYYLDYLLRTPPKHLRWVFIELAGMRTSVDRDKLGTVRGVYWHDWPRLRLLFERALYLRPERKKWKWRKELNERLEPLADFAEHLPLFIQNQTNLGRGSILTARLVSTAPARRAPATGTLGEDFAGWVRTGRPEEMIGSELAAFDKALAERRIAPPYRDPGDPVSQKALEIMLAKIEKLGATPVLIVPPTTNKRNFYPLPEREKKTLVLDFCDLGKFPELYEHRYRLDTDHLNTEGADVFTRIFVKTWAEKLRPKP